MPDAPSALTRIASLGVPQQGGYADGQRKSIDIPVNEAWREFVRKYGNDRVSLDGTIVDTERAVLVLDLATLLGIGSGPGPEPVANKVQLVDANGNPVSVVRTDQGVYSLSVNQVQGAPREVDIDDGRGLTLHKPLFVQPAQGDVSSDPLFVKVTNPTTPSGFLPATLTKNTRHTITGGNATWTIAQQSVSIQRSDLTGLRYVRVRGINLGMTPTASSFYTKWQFAEVSASINQNADVRAVFSSPSLPSSQPGVSGVRLMKTNPRQATGEAFGWLPMRSSWQPVPASGSLTWQLSGLCTTFSINSPGSQGTVTMAVHFDALLSPSTEEE